jgi:hypothetical protein
MGVLDVLRELGVDVKDRRAVLEMIYRINRDSKARIRMAEEWAEQVGTRLSEPELRYLSS